MNKEFYMDWQQFRLRFWKGQPVYCVEYDDYFEFYTNIGIIIIKTTFKKLEGDEQRLIFVQEYLSAKPDLYFVKETEEELDEIDVYYDDQEELGEDLKL